MGNDACWSQISREQVPLLGSNVACGLAFTGNVFCFLRVYTNLWVQVTNYIFQHCAIFLIQTFLRPYFSVDYKLEMIFGGFLFVFFPDYHVVADGYGGKGYLIDREDESRLESIVKEAQKECKEGKAVLLNVLIGKTNFRDGSISV